MYHVALNRTRSNNRHFNYDIVKTFRFHPRQRRHLGAAFDLENTNGVSPLHNLEGRPRSRHNSNASCITDIMPRPNKSTFTIPRSSQSSLSHCATTRPGIDAFSSGTNELSLFWQIIMPPEC